MIGLIDRIHTSAAVLAEELDRRQSYTSANFGERLLQKLQ
jgi:hypothetical protein